MSFNKVLAIGLAIQSGKSYKHLTYQKKNDGFLLENDPFGNQILSFPGSEQIQDWFENFDAIKVKRDGMGWIHDGFADTWDELKDEVIKRVDKNKPLYITGHSLGGAVACVCALSLFNSGYTNIRAIYTFGQPRVGNKEWFNLFTKSKLVLYRVKNGSDIITTVPKLFYWHVGEEIQINDRGFFSWIHDKFLDHKLEGYERCLKKL